MAWRGGWSVSKFGFPFPILALKSPHTSVTYCGWIVSKIFSIWVVAWASSMCLFVSDVVGGT